MYKIKCVFLQANKISMNINVLDSKGRFLPVMESFLSVQGEGFHTGLTSYFIRIGGCDVGCHWCDVKESWNPDLHPPVEVREIVKNVPDHIPTIVITGGEPTLYNLDFLIKELKKAGKQIHLETSGTGRIVKGMDWICLSPKKNENPKKDFYPVANELKIIIHNKTDFKFAEEQAKFVKRQTHLYLQPEWSNREKMTPLIIEYIKKNPRWKISLQTHKYLKIP